MHEKVQLLVLGGREFIASLRCARKQEARGRVQKAAKSIVIS